MSSLKQLRSQALMVDDIPGIRGVLHKLYKYQINKDELRYYEIVEDITGILIMKCGEILKPKHNYFPSIEIYNSGSLVDMLDLVKYCSTLYNVEVLYETMIDINFTSAFLQTKLHRIK